MSGGDAIDLREFIGGFVAEADELVAASTAALVEIEAANLAGTTRPKAVRELFRALHTLKGLAGMIGVAAIVELTHALEALVRIADHAGGALGPRAVEAGMQTMREIGERVRAVAEDRTPEPPPVALLATLEAADPTPAAAPAPPAPALDAVWEARLNPGERQQIRDATAAGRAVWTVTFLPSEARAAAGTTIATVRQRLGALGDIVKVVPRSLGAAGVAFELLLVSTAAATELAAAAGDAEVVPLSAPPPAPAAAPVVTEVPAAAPASAPAAALLPAAALDPDVEVTPLARAVVRVELARLDELQEHLSALTVSRFRLEREIALAAERGHDVRGLRELSDGMVRQLRGMRRGILRARLVRLADVLEPLQLLVRSLVRPGIKEARLEIAVRDAEIDKAVADRLLPAVIHLVRNAVDHAIEPVSTRTLRGKPRAGALRITCHELGGSQLELAIADDGGGIDRGDIARRAGVPVDDDAALLDVLTTAGFSTRDVATETSGRGLGLEIVRRIVASDLGGALSLTSRPGAGTLFRLRVPLTIAIVEVFSFECGGQAFVVPASAVEEIIDLDGAVRSEPPARRGAARSELVERRGLAMPLIPLARLLAAAPLGGDLPHRARKAIIARRAGQLVAFGVERMLGRHEVVVRPLADPLLRTPGISGATDLGDGRPTLVLDLGALASAAATSYHRGAS